MSTDYIGFYEETSKIFFELSSNMHLSDFIWPFLPLYKGVIPNQKVVFIFQILCILSIFSQNIKKIPNLKEKSAFKNPK